MKLTFKEALNVKGEITNIIFEGIEKHGPNNAWNYEIATDIMTFLENNKIIEVEIRVKENQDG